MGVLGPPYDSRDVTDVADVDVDADRSKNGPSAIVPNTGGKIKMEDPADSSSDPSIHPLMC